MYEINIIKFYIYFFYIFGLLEIVVFPINQTNFKLAEDDGVFTTSQNIKKNGFIIKLSIEI